MKNQTQTPLTAAILFAVITTLCVFNLQPAFAGTRTWNGGATPDGNWTNPGNWNGVAPTTNDLLVFNGNTQTATTNNFPANTPFNNITFNNGAGAFTIFGNAIALSEPTDAGSGQIANGSINNLSSNAETIRAPLLILDGNHKITSTGGFLRFNGSITRSNGAVVAMSGNINVTGGLSTNGAANGILGGWAIYNNNWATLDASSNIVAYTGYTDVASPGPIANNSASNVRVPTAGATINITTPATAINSFLLSAGNAAQTIGIGAGNKLVLGQNGGIYNSSPIASGGTYRNLTVGANLANGGILTAGDGINPATITVGSPPLASGSTGFLTVNSSIQDNGAPVTLVIAGAYVSLNGSGPGAGTFPTNTYSGGTYVLQGRFSQANPFSVGSGPIHIYPGGQVNCGWPITNNFDISGSGTTENNGMGALRLYSANINGGITGNLPGTIYLRGAASVCADNLSSATNVLGFSGKITGPGSLSIGSVTATSRSGVINIGSTNGTSNIPNDYAGDTMINGINGGITNSTLRICHPNDTNIMPHGATGSFAGGATGNLILNAAVTNNLQAIFDLNGSIQTINGLASTPRNPSFNFVIDSTGGGSLILGDNNASSTFAGSIQNSLSLTKIGTGAINVSGPNTYTGDTVVKAGRLVTTTASTGAGNYSVSNSAALGVTVATSGGTLNVGNMTLASGSSLQLNAGTFGNPSAPVVSISGTLTLVGPVNISLSGIGLTGGGPAFRILHYTGAIAGGGSFTLANSPRVVATLSNDVAGGDIYLTITSADSGIKWNGGVGGVWDINNAGNTIWQTVPSGSTTFYIESGSGNDLVTFNDTATGTTSVNLTTNVSPQSIAVTNTSKSYSFTGSGRITGLTGLTKDGTNTLTIGNSGNNDFSGPIAINAGTLVISNNWSIGNTISGAGALAKNGPGTLTLSGDGSAYTGPVTVNGGTLQLLNTLSLGTASSTTVANGAALDIGVNSVSLPSTEPLTVSGSGMGGNGAIINSSGYSGGAVATSFQNLIMAGDTTIGGPGRLDFADGTLSTSGVGRKLTKVSISTLRMANLTVDNALGDIEVQGGTLSIQGAMSSLGNPASNFIVAGAAILQFNALSSDINKGLILQDNGVVNNSGGGNTLDGPVTLLGNGIFNVGGSGFAITNVISGTGSLSKVTGTQPLTLTASNTYTGDTIIGAGTLALSEPGSIGASHNITISSGATLDVLNRNDQTLTLLSGQTLLGSGILNGGLVATNGATLSPGTGVGTLTVNVNVSLAPTAKIVMEINKTVPANDVLNCFGLLTYGGTLVISNVGPAFADGDSFTLFPNPNYDGAFSAIVPATPGSGLAWDTNSLSIDGSLKVVVGTITNPTTNASITKVTQSGTNVIVHGTNNNVPNTSFHYAVVTTTNLSLPLTNWTPVMTNPFNPDGTFDYTNPIVPGTPRQFIDVLAVP